jgi:hypothetical protein
MTLDARDLNKLFEELVPVQVAKPDGKVLGGRQAENLTLVTNAGEGDVGMGHSQDLDLLKNVRRLGLLSPQKLAAGGDVEEEVRNLNPRAGSLPGILNLVNPASGDLNEGSGEILAAARGETEPGNAGDARDRLTPESKSGDGGEVGTFPDLAGGVALQREQGIGAIHSGTVITHTDVTCPTALKLYGDAMGSRIDGVLDQLLDDGGGTLHHFACGNLACQDIGKYLDAAHEGKSKKGNKVS